MVDNVIDKVNRKGGKTRNNKIATKTWKCFILQKHSTKNPMTTKSYRKSAFWEIPSAKRNLKWLTIDFN